VAPGRRDGMPTLPVIVLGLLMAIGLGAVAVLAVRLKIRVARRRPPAPAPEPTIEDELQAIIDASAQTPRAR
jgi:cytochrome b561